MDKSGHTKNLTDRGPLTLWRPHREGQVRTRKASDRQRPTHQLETTQGGTSQDTKESDRPRPTHHLETAQGGTSQDTKKKHLTNRCPLTSWRPHTDGQVRTRKASDQPRPTHFLGTTQGGTSQDMQRIRPTEAHSLPGDRTRRYKSGNEKNPTDRGPLTSWRPQRDR